jgi:hypothetical protein
MTTPNALKFHWFVNSVFLSDDEEFLRTETNNQEGTPAVLSVEVEEILAEICITKSVKGFDERKDRLK